jgi:hypothetical protein
MFVPGWNLFDIGYRAHERALHKVVRTVDIAGE